MQTLKPGYQSFEAWVAAILGLIGTVQAAGLLTNADPKIGAYLSAISLVGLLIQRAFKLWTVTPDQLGAPASGLKAPEVTAETAALTAAIADVLAKWPKPGASVPPQVVKP
jgi:hypothetical protein